MSKESVTTAPALQSRDYQSEKLADALREAVRIASDEKNEVFKGNLISREIAIRSWMEAAIKAISEYEARKK